MEMPEMRFLKFYGDSFREVIYPRRGKTGDKVIYPRRQKFGMFNVQIEFEFKTEILIVNNVIMAQPLCGFLLLLSTHSI